MAYAYVEVELKEISTSDLLDELEDRYIGNRELESLLKRIDRSDARKLELFLRVMDRYSVLELAELFNEVGLPAAAPKEQLAINF